MNEEEPNGDSVNPQFSGIRSMAAFDIESDITAEQEQAIIAFFDDASLQRQTKQDELDFFSVEGLRDALKPQE
jgi:hypothetical protein